MAQADGVELVHHLEALGPGRFPGRVVHAAERPQVVHAELLAVAEAAQDVQYSATPRDHRDLALKLGDLHHLARKFRPQCFGYLKLVHIFPFSTCHSEAVRPRNLPLLAGDASLRSA